MVPNLKGEGFQIELFLNGGDARLKIHGGFRKGGVRVFKDRHTFGIDPHCIGRFSREKIGNLFFRNWAYPISIEILHPVLMKNPGEHSSRYDQDAQDKTNPSVSVLFHSRITFSSSCFITRCC